jgi:hypothetical protein
VNPLWANPSGKWRVGGKRLFELIPRPLQVRVRACVRVCVCVCVLCALCV